MQLPLLAEWDQLEVHRIGQQVPKHFLEEARDSFLLEVIHEPGGRCSRRLLASPKIPERGLASTELGVKLSSGQKHALSSKSYTDGDGEGYERQ
jgi:hypothetical protein